MGTTATLYDRALAAVKAVIPETCKPGDKIGQCKAAYVVVYDGGMIPVSRATGYRVIGVSALVPKARHDELGPLLKTASAALATMGLKPRGSPGAEGVDPDYGACVQNIEYIAPCAL